MIKKLLMFCIVMNIIFRIMLLQYPGSLPESSPTATPIAAVPPPSPTSVPALAPEPTIAFRSYTTGLPIEEQVSYKPVTVSSAW